MLSLLTSSIIAQLLVTLGSLCQTFHIIPEFTKPIRPLWLFEKLCCILQEITNVPALNAAEPNLCKKFDWLVFVEGVTGKALEANTLFDKYQTPTTVVPLNGAVICAVAAKLGLPRDLQPEITPLLTAKAPTVIICGLVTFNELLCATPLTIASSIFKLKV